MKFRADLHIHSPYSRATSKRMTPENIYKWCSFKGIDLAATGDFTHYQWISILKKSLNFCGNGLFELKPKIRKHIDKELPESCIINPKFILSSEISCIYKKNNKTRKVHNVIIMPDFDSVDKFNRILDKIGNIRYDGRPIIGIDSKNLLEIALSVNPNTLFIPAHIWTPHFSVLGAFSDFNSIEECFEDLTQYIYAVETGLSSDPPMNWRVSSLDKFSLVSNSDSHSPENLGRECNLFDTKFDYYSILNSLKTKKGFNGTIEFFPEEGRYHYDGHRNCSCCLHPSETIKNNYICPVCKKKVTVGVLHRVEKLADRASGKKPAKSKPFKSLIPLHHILSQILKKGKSTKTVSNEYTNLINTFGSELDILTLDFNHRDSSSNYIVDYISEMNNNNLDISPGYDGEYGKILIKGT